MSLNKRKAIFLDRDGVLIEEVNYLSKFSDVKFFNDVPAGLNTLKKSGYMLIIVTNQSGVARGMFTEDFVQKTYKKMNQMLKSFKVQFDDLYYCPHHPDGMPPFNVICECRKPQPGMIKSAVADYDIDISRSFLIGDKISDIELAINSKVPGILVKTGYGTKDSNRVTEKYPQIPQFSNFSTAIDYITLNSK